MPRTVDLTNQTPQPIDLVNNVDSNKHDTKPWARQAYVGDCTIINGQGYKYAVWTVTIETIKGSKIVIYRRYRDFERLYTGLKDYYPERANQVPPIPPKNKWGMIQGPWNPNFDSDFLQRRQRGLEYFINGVLLNPIFCQTSVVRKFVTNSV